MKRRRGNDDKHGRGASGATKDEQFAQLYGTFGRPAVLGIATALLVSTPLIASEAIVAEGAGASWHVMWLAVAFVSLACSTLIAAPAQRWSWADLCVGLLIGWHVVSTLVCDGDLRHAWNATWQWGAYGAIAVVLRQQLMPGKETRALVGVMLALAMAVSFHAYYQYAYSQPQMRAQFAKNPESMLKQMNVDTEPGSPGRTNAENRINSLEPTAEFALTNSLAGFLLPWFLVALAIAFWSVQRDGLVLTIAAALVIAAVLAGVLLLTKSRSAVLAAVGGCALILLYCRRTGWRIDWRWPAGIAAAGLVIALIAVAAKGLDAQVLSESPKSVLYRLEYWRATAALIAEEPLFGVGPGNFKERYTNHKLPQASENISDPHNFLLEIWSTAGTPALLALLALMVTTAWHIGRVAPVNSDVATAVESATSHNLSAQEPPLELGPAGICAGAVLGLLLAGIMGLVVGDPLDTTGSADYTTRGSSFGLPVIWLCAALAYVFCFFMLREWVERGELPRAAVIGALLALLVNLLAAGAAIYPGVVNAAWVLWAIAMQGAPVTSALTSAADESTSDVTRRKVLGWALTCLMTAALCACYYTEFLPVTSSRGLLDEALSSNTSQQRLAAMDEVVAADPWSADLKGHRALFRLGAWLADPNSDDAWQSFQDSLAEYRKASPHHFVVYDREAKWLLLAAHRVRNPEYRELAAQAFEEAVKRFPNSAYQHAQLAFVYAEQGRSDDAAREAKIAIQLDALCPHKELKLENRKLYDPQWAEIKATGKYEAATGPNAAEFVNKYRGEDHVRPETIP